MVLLEVTEVTESNILMVHVTMDAGGHSGSAIATSGNGEQR